MSEPLEDWIDNNKARQLFKDIATHIECGGTEEAPRLIMISVRQWAEETGRG